MPRRQRPRFQKPTPPTDLRTPQTASVVQLKNEYLSGQLDGLTPARLGSILRDADMGDLWAQHRLFSDMEERCAHLACEIGKRRRAPLCLDWSIEPPRGASADEKDDAAWLTEMFTDIQKPRCDAIAGAMEAVGHGFAAVELTWEYDGGQLLPRFQPQPQEWFRLNQDRSELRLRDGSVDGAPLRPFGWIIHTAGKPKTGYIGRLGLHRTLVWPFLYLAYAIGDFAELLETWGLPMLVGKYMGAPDDAEKNSLLRAVRALGHDARAIMPADMELEIVQAATAGGGGTPHMDMVDWAERSISKAILGQTMSAEAKATGIGSGNADLHDEVRKDIAVADVQELAATLTRDVLYPMLALNRGANNGLTRCPRLVFDTAEPEDVTAYAQALPKLVSIGMRIPEDWAHEKLRIPVAKEGERVLQVSTPLAAADGEEDAQGQEAGGTKRQPGSSASGAPKENGVHKGREGREGRDAQGSRAGREEAALTAAAAGASDDLAADRRAAEADALDELRALMEDEWQPHASALLSPLAQLAQRAGSIEEFRDGLPKAIAEMDAGEIADVLAKGLFAAHLAGRALPGPA